MAPISCGFTPMLFGDKSVKLVQRIKNYPKWAIYQNPKKTKGLGKHDSSGPACSFILMMELRKKIITFRHIIDLPPCSTSISTNQLLVGTLKDLQKFYPGSLPHFHRSELKRLPLDKMLIYFCKALHELGDNTSKMSDEWIDKYKYDIYENEKCTNVDKHVEIATAELDELIKVARQQLAISEHDDEENKGLNPKGKKSKDLKKTSSKNSSGCPSPTSVVPEAATDSPNSSSVTVSFRVQSVGKTSHMDVRRLKLLMFRSFGLQLPSCLNPKKVASDEEEEEKRDYDASLKIKASIVDGNEDLNDRNKAPEEPVSSGDHKTADDDDECNTKLPSTEAEVSTPSSPSPVPSAEVLSTPPAPPPPAFLQPKVKEVSRGPPLPPPLSLKLKPHVVENEQELPSTKTVIPPPPPPPPAPLKSTVVVKGAKPPLPPPVPLQPVASASGILAPKPTLSKTFTKKYGPFPPPPPPPPPAPLKSSVVAKGAQPPLPPPVPLQSEASASGILAPTLTLSRTFTKKYGPLLPPLPPPLPPAPLKSTVVAKGEPLPPPHPPAPLKSTVAAKGAQAPLPPPVPLQSEATASGILAPTPTLSRTFTKEYGPFPPPPPPPPQAPLKSTVVAKGAQAPLPPPVLLQSEASASGILAPTPTLSRTFTKEYGPLPPPPPMSAANGATPPPPPPPGGAAKSARTRRTGSKLRRSSHMSNLYRNLKGKVEGSPVQGKSLGIKKSEVKSDTNGKQGMADALAEMTKRSSYFQQIEKDIEKYAKSIYELKVAIGKFKTKDMPELLKFHKHVESILENLTDETQVLARYEDFPIKKLEALRTSSSLYSKLESMMNELESLKTEPPLSQLLDKVTCSFNKIKGEIDSMERTKENEAKTFKAYGIEFDFQIITRIKEATVDVSSNCMDLALKERREVKMAENEGFKTKDCAQNKASIKMLWRVFQFAFQVYTFAGGHDDRAEKLTQELAHEIENDAEYQNEATATQTPRRRKHKPRRMGSRNKNPCPTCTPVPT